MLQPDLSKLMLADSSRPAITAELLSFSLLEVLKSQGEFSVYLFSTESKSLQNLTASAQLLPPIQRVPSSQLILTSGSLSSFSHTPAPNGLKPLCVYSSYKLQLIIKLIVTGQTRQQDRLSIAYKCLLISVNPSYLFSINTLVTQGKIQS